MSKTSPSTDGVHECKGCGGSLPCLVWECSHYAGFEVYDDLDDNELEEVYDRRCGKD
jgi:hypothetical protein